MEGEENSCVGEDEDLLLLLSSPREAMSSTKEGNAVIACDEEMGMWGGVIGALGDLGRERSDGIVAFKRMGVVKCWSPFGMVDRLGEGGEDKRAWSARQLRLDLFLPRRFRGSSPPPSLPINHESTTTAGCQLPTWRLALHGPKTRNGVSLCRCTQSLHSFVYNSQTILKTDCGAKNEIRPREPIRCRECGHRIMYKKRTKRSKFFLIAETC